MLRIQKSSDDGVTLSLSGRIEIGDVAELERLLRLEATSSDVTFDLRDITLVDRDAVRFLARCEAERIQLRNCPAYIRQWITADQSRTNGGTNRQEH